ncbi:hypothetical protein [Clostridium beijerinckii]|uniref:Uncharacterized protein n=1 Tax=Clostridium beijerinckii TaxID=1520 RepID=A0AAX0B8X1_CLOBE|nr:hypothetical protein [Clostridium beijerinckii]NRT90924.1 hypothetical protein [Clostridium beijerinckii]NYC70450.1 hypothetical protein [Clostridium beijerinckii]
MSNKKKLIINLKFNNQERVECARSPDLCKECEDRQRCEELELFYYSYSKKDILKCITNDERRR